MEITWVGESRFTWPSVRVKSKRPLRSRMYSEVVNVPPVIRVIAIAVEVTLAPVSYRGMVMLLPAPERKTLPYPPLPWAIPAAVLVVVAVTEPPPVTTSDPTPAALPPMASVALE